MLDFPCAPHHFYLPEVWDDLGPALRSLGRFEDAIEARRSAIAAGYQSDPDPEAEIAELLLELGRREEADRLYAELRRRDPDDVWLYNSAGWMYAAIGDHETALRWLDTGIELAMEFGDADHVLDPLTDMRRRSLDALDRAADDDPPPSLPHPVRERRNVELGSAGCFQILSRSRSRNSRCVEPLVARPQRVFLQVLTHSLHRRDANSLGQRRDRSVPLPCGPSAGCHGTAGRLSALARNAAIC